MIHSPLKKIRIKDVISATGVVTMLLIGATEAKARSWNDVPGNSPRNFNTPYNPGQYVYNLNQLPTEAVLPNEQTPWSDSYWPKQRGAFAYRWHQFQGENEDQIMSVDDRRQKYFNYHFYTRQELHNMTADQIAMLSPLEKYAIFISDRDTIDYSIAQRYLNGKGNGPERVSWEGYCHAWAPAATHYPEPAPVTLFTYDGIPVPFGSGDVKALLTANYHEQMFPTGLSWVFATRPQKSYVGGGGGGGCPTNVAFLNPATRVRNGKIELADFPDTDGLMDSDLEKNVREYQESLKKILAENPTSDTLPRNASTLAYDTDLPAKARRDADSPACSGVNAGTFHVVMANQIGLMKRGFELDKTRDGQIWNQPARGFHSKIVGYESPSPNAAPGTVKVAIVETGFEFADDTDYGWAFWNPTLTNLFRPEANFLAEYANYMKTLIKIGDETEPGQYPYDIMDTVHYKYKLELDSSGNIIGGEWLTLDRPDTLWIMEDLSKRENKGFKGAFERLIDIYKPAQF